MFERQTRISVGTAVNQPENFFKNNLKRKLFYLFQIASKTVIFYVFRVFRNEIPFVGNIRLLTGNLFVYILQQAVIHVVVQKRDDTRQFVCYTFRSFFTQPDSQLVFHRFFIIVVSELRFSVAEFAYKAADRVTEGGNFVFGVDYQSARISSVQHFSAVLPTGAVNDFIYANVGFAATRHTLNKHITFFVGDYFQLIVAEQWKIYAACAHDRINLIEFIVVGIKIAVANDNRKSGMFPDKLAKPRVLSSRRLPLVSEKDEIFVGYHSVCLYLRAYLKKQFVRSVGSCCDKTLYPSGFSEKKFGIFCTNKPFGNFC